MHLVQEHQLVGVFLLEVPFALFAHLQRHLLQLNHFKQAFEHGIVVAEEELTHRLKVMVLGEFEHLPEHLLPSPSLIERLH